jgi:hypothetical protein
MAQSRPQPVAPLIVLAGDEEEFHGRVIKTEKLSDFGYKDRWVIPIHDTGSSTLQHINNILKFSPYAVGTSYPSYFDEYPFFRQFVRDLKKFDELGIMQTNGLYLYGITPYGSKKNITFTIPYLLTQKVHQLIIQHRHFIDTNPHKDAYELTDSAPSFDRPFVVYRFGFFEGVPPDLKIGETVNFGYTVAALISLKKTGFYCYYTFLMSGGKIINMNANQILMLFEGSHLKSQVINLLKTAYLHRDENFPLFKFYKPEDQIILELQHMMDALVGSQNPHHFIAKHLNNLCCLLIFIVHDGYLISEPNKVLISPKRYEVKNLYPITINCSVTYEGSKILKEILVLELQQR